MNNEIQFFPLLVPAHHYPQMVRILSDLMEGQVEAGFPRTSAPLRQDSPAKAEWTPEDVRKLRQLIANNKTAMKMMELTTVAPGERVSFEMIYEQAGRTYDQARADLAGLSRTIHKNFGQQRGWPVEYIWDAERNATFYYVVLHIAESWNESDS